MVGGSTPATNSDCSAFVSPIPLALVRRFAEHRTLKPGTSELEQIPAEEQPSKTEDFHHPRYGVSRPRRVGQVSSRTGLRPPFGPFRSGGLVLASTVFHPTFSIVAWIPALKQAPPGTTVLVGRRYNQYPIRKTHGGLGSIFGHLDSGSTLHIPVRKFPEATESSCFIDTQGACRSARNDDRRDDSP